MEFKKLISHSIVKEFLFQMTLNILVFVFYAYDKQTQSIDFIQIYFYLNYAFAAIFISYVLLPKFLYKNRYLEFSIAFVLIIGLVIYVEEAVLEQVFFPETRGRRFSKMFYNLLSTMPTLSILIGLKFAWDALTKQREVLELRNSVRESELQFLKSQINPHFLFNNMNNLYSYAVEQSPKTPEIILELSSVLRYMLYECKARFVPLQKEMQHLENYMNLSKLQIEGRGEVSIQIGDIGSGYRMAPLILTVFIENAFKHSGSSQTDNIKIDLKAYVDTEGVLHFMCENTFLEQSNTESLDSGIGLENVRKRLQLIYPNSHKLSIQKKNHFYKVKLSVDLSKSQ